ncbi:hypothetical protein FSP39_019152 [Pinctada imbricata]|uniref:Reverse transcriptase domain-containing protein n=1 Tax=Pinctada imbricata TaxID=66713 RepID=A0AA88XN01_PINIB|nr:hypothetical protein FSP39_019152 [Pinctada imbricata]
MNCALIIEEFVRESKDQKSKTFLSLLDARAAFDMVWHSSLLRKLYLQGIEGNLWILIQNMHEDITSCVKWNGQFSNSFMLTQGVRQGGTLSSDFYKLYVNTLLDRIQNTGIGGHIGDINCAAPTCEDDMSQLSTKESELQILCNVAENYSVMEHYELQPAKSVILPVNTSGKKSDSGHTSFEWKLKDTSVPIANEAVHVGITRNVKGNCESTIQNNIQKARRTLYSLMSSGMHGENGLDPKSCIHLLNVYVMPVLLYGLEILLPSDYHCQPLEIFLKKTLKQILSIPVSTADPAPFILSGCIPVEAIIHKRALTFYCNICRLPESAIEKQLAHRQCSIKSLKSHSWFIAIKKLLIKYDLPDINDVLKQPPTKYTWNKLVNRKVNDYWKTKIMSSAGSYSSLRHLDPSSYKPGKIHPIATTENPTNRDITRLAVKLKIVTGTYLLQCNRAAFNHQDSDPTCLMCKSEPETAEHFLLRCERLAETRDPLLLELNTLSEDLFNVTLWSLSQTEKMNFILNIYSAMGCHQNCGTFDFHTRRYCYSLHVLRYKILCNMPTRKRYGLCKYVYSF